MSRVRLVMRLRHESSPPIRSRSPTCVLVESDLRMREGDLEGAHRALMAHAELLVDTDRRRAATMLLLALKLRIFRLEGKAAADEVEGVLALLPAGEHELVHLVALSMSRTVAGRDGARDSALAAAAAAANAPHGHAHTLGIAWPLIWLEEYDVAREVTDRAIAIQREAGFLLYLPQSLLPRAELDFRTGRWEPAMAAADEALGLFEETQQASEVASAAAVLPGWRQPVATPTNAERMHSAPWRATSSSVFAAPPRTHLQPSAFWRSARAGRTRRSLRSRQPSGLRRTALSASRGCCCLRPTSSRRSLTPASTLVRWRCCASFEARAAAVGRVSALAAAARCAGILDAEGLWEDAFEDALALHAQVPTPFERARTELCYGERLRRARRRADARARLRSALEVFDELGARPWSERARASCGRAGETARRRSTPVDALTQQELAVAKLVVGRRDESRRSGDALRQPEDDRVPPRQRLSQARGALAHRARPGVRREAELRAES